MRFSNPIGAFVAAAVLTAGSLGATAAVTNRTVAERSLMDGRINEAVSQLTSILAANPHDGAAHLLLCRAYFAEEASDLAVQECESALSHGGPPPVLLHDWMGRAYGQKASHALVGAYGLAKRVKIEFEAAVAADGSNVDAANDLSEFYIGAPGMVGGDVQKALALADRVEKSMPQAAHRMRALAAQERKEYPTAETEFKAAVGVAGRTNAWVDLAEFYHKRKRYDDAVATIRKAEQSDPAHDNSLMDLASILLEMKRNYPDAIRLLRLYLLSGTKTDAGPAPRAHYLLGKLLEKSNDKNGARHEYEAAIALASKYEQAQRALDAL